MISTDADLEKATSAYDFVVLDSKKHPYNLNKHRGNPTLFVNVASQCDLTKDSYTAMTLLYDHYKSRGFSVIGFPCNQFANQEPGDEAAVEKFACTKFNATYPLMAKVNVNGPDASPLWKWLKNRKPGTCGDNIKWNFTSFLVDREGNVIERYSPGVSVDDVEDDLVGALSAKGAYQKKEKTCC